MTQLLVSVRSAAEAEAALRGGAALIDVKEPAHGSLGRASDEVIADVVRVVAGRRPISAAMGELLDAPGNVCPPNDMPLTFVKWGLAGYTDRPAAVWRSALRRTLCELTGRQLSCRTVAVAYADWQRAQAPIPEEVCHFAVENGIGACLIDTWQKDGSTLLDWLSLQEIEHLQKSCRTAGVPMALAGSLGRVEIRLLLPLRPDWIAVRGAVCQGRQRSATVDEGKVRQLALLLSPALQTGQLGERGALAP
jgi:(5-formylfuran-3-yl)methyl phosphate synthase